MSESTFKDLLPGARWNATWWRKLLARTFGTAIESVDYNWITGVQRVLLGYRWRGVVYVVEARTEKLPLTGRMSVTRERRRNRT